MARPRTPKAKAAATGADQKNKGRFDDRNEPVIDADLGDPPDWLKDTENNKPRQAWATLKREVPWLNESHRMLVATVSNQLGRLIAGQEIGVQASVFIKQCLSEMGATPSAASKVGAKPDGEQEDPAAQYFK